MYKAVVVAVLLFAAVVLCKDGENKLNKMAKCVEECDNEKCMRRCFNNYRFMFFQKKEKKVKPASDEDGPVTQEGLMQKYMDALYAHYSNFVGSGSRVQILGKPIEAVWDTKKNVLSEFGNQMSSYTSRNYVVEAKKAPFCNAYGEFLNNLNDVSSTDKTEVTALREQLVKAEADYDKFIKEQYEPKEKSCADLYEKTKASLPGTFEDFKRKYCVMTYLESRKQQLSGNVKMLQYRINQVSRETKAEIALSSFNGAKGNFEWVEKTGKLAQFKANIAAGQASGFTLVVSTSSSSSEESETTEETVSTKKSKTSSDDVTVEKTVKLSLSTKSSKFYMRIEIPAHYVLDVAPANWFDYQAVSNYRTGPFKDAAKATSYFGEKGSINMMKSKLYLVHKPKVVMHLNEADAQFCSSLKESTTYTGIELLPFTLDPKTIQVTKLSTKPEVSTGGEGEKMYKVEFEAKEADPLVIAVENLVL